VLNLKELADGRFLRNDPREPTESRLDLWDPFGIALDLWDPLGISNAPDLREDTENAVEGARDIFLLFHTCTSKGVNKPMMITIEEATAMEEITICG